VLFRSGNNGQRKQQASRELSLHQLRIRLGLVDELVETAAVAAAAERKERNQRHRHRRQTRAAECLNELLETLAPQVLSCRHFLPDLCVGHGSQEMRLDWARVPASLQPWSDELGGLAHDPRRVDHKRWQLESLFVALSYVLAHHRTDVRNSLDEGTDGGKLHIVDFGSGSGNSVLAIAALLPSHNFTLVEACENDLSIARRRIASAALQNVKVWHGDLADFPETFDLGLATHLCGEGTDLAQAKCIEQGAAFVLTPCCLGMIKHVLEGCSRNRGVSANIRSKLPGEGLRLSYPRSDWLQRQMEPDLYLQLVRLSDCNSGSDASSGAAAASKQLIDADRLMRAAEAGYETGCGKLWPLEASAKNDVLVGWPFGSDR